MTTLEKLEQDRKDIEAHLDFYTGLHEGNDLKAIKDMEEAIADLREKIRRCESDAQADA